MGHGASTNLRLTPEVLARADALIAHLEHVQGRSCTRSDVLREAIAQGLRALEGEQRDLASDLEEVRRG